MSKPGAGNDDVAGDATAVKKEAADINDALVSVTHILLHFDTD